MASSFLDRPIDKGTVVFGEVGLAGEVRESPRWTSGSRRQPAWDSCAASFLRHLPEMDSAEKKMECIRVNNLKKLLEYLF